MDSTDSNRARGAVFRLGLGIAVWTSLGLFDATHSYLRYNAIGDPIAWPQALGMGLGLWYGWAILSLFVAAFTRRVPFAPQAWLRPLALHLVVGAGFALVKMAMDYPVIELFYCPDPGLMPFTKFMGMAFASQFHKYVLIYWALVGAWHALNYCQKYQERAGKASQLETRLGHSQLQLLKMQLHPHFLFNTLNAISALIHTDADVADRMLARLGDLLRLTLQKEGVQEVSLREELEFLDAYLEIEQVRFGPRLTVARHIDPGLLEAQVPYLILQPLVENAIRHGILRTGVRGRIEIRARRCAGTLRLDVSDNGLGLPAGNGPLRKGIGLANTRARLRQLYGDDQRFELRPGDRDGAVATVEVPFREAAVQGC